MEDPMQLVEYLTMKDIISEAGPNMLSYKSKRRRADLIQAIQESPDLQEIVIRAFHRKQSRQMEGRENGIKQARLKDPVVEEDGNHNDTAFLKNPDDDIKKTALAQFIDHTGNTHTRQSSCLSCVREELVDSMDGIYLGKLPNQHLLTPAYQHPAQSLIAGMLLYRPAICQSDKRQWGGICSECLQDLQANKMPQFSLANGLWIGDVPDELAILNLPERLLLGLYFPAVYIIKLYPQQKGAKHWDSTALNSGV
ncbi:hypothetical protein C8R48DRAFT_769355 [Suillus tomentosus]|nr:hypothetical protein C8R48DRAFT_769355 [Suillus tomentosus]